MKYHLSCMVITTPAVNQGPETNVSRADEFGKSLVVIL